MITYHPMIVCDECSSAVFECSIMEFPNDARAKAEAEVNGWHTNGDVHRCPKCALSLALLALENPELHGGLRLQRLAAVANCDGYKYLAETLARAQAEKVRTM